MTGFIQSVIKNTRQLVMLDKGASTVTTANQVLAKTTGGLVIPATSSTARSEVEGICNQTIAAAEALTQVPYEVPSEGDTYIFSTTNNTDKTHNGQAMIIGANSTTINNTGTTSAVGVVVQVEPFGVTTDKLIIGKFISA